MLNIAIVIMSFFLSTASAKTVLITGSSRGLGMEMAMQYAIDGWDVIATARTPEDDKELQALARAYASVQIEKLDVTDHSEIEALAEKLQDTAIDILINNAGILGDPSQQQLGKLDFSVANVVFMTNTLGPLKIAEAFLEHIARSDTKKIMTISSIVGSITNTTGNIYFYRASKTAVNMMMTNLAADTKHRGIIVGMIHPGVVDTDMTAPFNIPKVSVNESAAGVRKVIAWYTTETSARFMQYDGEPMDW
ncbi:MAG: SDR family oxidoreductase [Rhodospirillaceae bacterium]